MTERDAKNYLKMKKLVGVFSKKDKVRRGYVHATICEVLGITHNHKNVYLIKKALMQYSPKEVRIRGLEYYRFKPYNSGLKSDLK